MKRVYKSLIFKNLTQQQNKWEVGWILVVKSYHPPTFLLLAINEYIVSF